MSTDKATVRPECDNDSFCCLGKPTNRGPEFQVQPLFVDNLDGRTRFLSAKRRRFAHKSVPAGFLCARRALISSTGDNLSAQRLRQLSLSLIVVEQNDSPFVGE